MSVRVGIEVAELLASRLCHDLVGPLGAVNNGLELMAEDDPSMMAESLELVQGSANQGTDILQFFRLAYGMAGAQAGDDPDRLLSILAGFLAHKKATLIWQDVALPEWLPEGGGKLLLNMVALAEEMLPRGGAIEIGFDDKPALRIKLTGKGAGPRDGDLESILAGNLPEEDLTPRNVHGHFTNLVAQRLGGSIALVCEGEESLVLEFSR